MRYRDFNVGPLDSRTTRSYRVLAASLYFVIVVIPFASACCCSDRFLCLVLFQPEVTILIISTLVIVFDCRDHGFMVMVACPMRHASRAPNRGSSIPYRFAIRRINRAVPNRQRTPLLIKSFRLPKHAQFSRDLQAMSGFRSLCVGGSALFSHALVTCVLNLSLGALSALRSLASTRSIYGASNLDRVVGEGSSSGGIFQVFFCIQSGLYGISAATPRTPAIAFGGSAR